MKLQGVHSGRLYASYGRTILKEQTRGDRAFETLGRLPNPLGGIDAFRYTLLTTQPWKSVAEWVVGAYQTTNVWPITDDVLLATAGRYLFVTHDSGTNWRVSRQLLPSSGLAGVLPSGVCVHDTEIYLGEYPLDDDAVPRILRSSDAGRTWTTVLEAPHVRHIHSVQVDPYAGEIWVTTGDRDEECHIGRLRDGRFEVVGGGDQRWRAVELVFTPSSIIWGMDCAYADRNHVFRLDRADADRVRTQTQTPRIESVTTVPNSVYFGASLVVDDTQWIVFSTAAEAGEDSTAPTSIGEREPTAEENRATVIASAATSRFTEWYEIGRFRTRRRPIEYVDYRGYLPVANTYVFLGADDDRGLFVNPYNTASDHGRIIDIPSETFERLAETHTV